MKPRIGRTTLRLRDYGLLKPIGKNPRAAGCCGFTRRPEAAASGEIPALHDASIVLPNGASEAEIPAAGIG